MRGPRLTFGPFRFDPGRRLLERDGVELALPPRVLGVLEVLLRRPGDVVSRQELMDNVWKDAFVTDTSLAEAVSVLRQTLGDDPQAPSYIQTLHRRGYRFVAEVEEQAPRETPASPARVEEAGEHMPVSIGGQLVPWSLAAICAAAAIVAGWQAVTNRGGAPVPVTRFDVAPAPGTRFDMRAPAAALSPDGLHAVWSACDGSGCRLYVRHVGRLEPQALPGTDGAAAPFFSPDGRSLGFFADGRLKKVALAGGAPVTLAEAADPLGAAWIDEGTIVYAGGATGLMRVPDAGGRPVRLTAPDPAAGEVRHAWPSVHPSSGLLLFTIVTMPEALAGGRLAAVRLADGAPRWTTLMPSVGRAMPVARDVLAVAAGAELQVAGFDPDRQVIDAAPQTVLTDLAVARGAGYFGASPAGLFTIARASAAREGTSLFWWSAGVNGSGGSRGEVPVRDFESAVLSPDGQRAAGLVRADASRFDVWVADLARGTSSRVTHAGANAAPLWSADGAQVLFAASEGGPFAIYRRGVDSSGAPVLVHRSSTHAFPASAAADGSLLAFVTTDRATGWDIWTLPSGGEHAEPLVRTPFDDLAPALSPNARLVAYQSNDAGRWEVYVHRRSDGRRIPVSTGGGTDPFWSADGTLLFFRSDGSLMRAAIGVDGVAASAPQVVTRIEDAVPIGQHPDGRILFRGLGAPADRGVVALHWLQDARQLLGPRGSPMPR